MLIDAKSGAVLGDPLGRLRSQSPETVHLLLTMVPASKAESNKHGRRNSARTQPPGSVSPGVVMGGTRGVRRLATAMLNEIVRVLVQQHKRKGLVTDSRALSQLASNEFVLSNVNLVKHMAMLLGGVRRSFKHAMLEAPAPLPNKNALVSENSVSEMLLQGQFNADCDEEAPEGAVPRALRGWSLLGPRLPFREIELLDLQGRQRVRRCRAAAAFHGNDRFQIRSPGYAKECIVMYIVVRKSIVDEAIRRLGGDKFGASQENTMDWEVLEVKVKLSPSPWPCASAAKRKMKLKVRGERKEKKSNGRSEKKKRRQCGTQF